MRAALDRAGLHDPGAELRTLELRDRAVTRTLDASLEGLPDERVDARGRVLLEQGFDVDVDAVLADELARTRRWKGAAAHDRTYAQSREQFEQDDQLHLESGLDLVRTLERAPQLARSNSSPAETPSAAAIFAIVSPASVCADGSSYRALDLAAIAQGLGTSA